MYECWQYVYDIVYFITYFEEEEPDAKRSEHRGNHKKEVPNILMTVRRTVAYDYNDLKCCAKFLRPLRLSSQRLKHAKMSGSWMPEHAEIATFSPVLAF